MKEIYFTILLMVILFLFVGCAEEPDDTIPEEKNCNVDSDCAPASCCHAASCVNIDLKPDCTGIMCTMDCKPNTMDCGQGKCVCQDNECIAEIQGMIT